MEVNAIHRTRKNESKRQLLDVKNAYQENHLSTVSDKVNFLNSLELENDINVSKKSMTNDDWENKKIFIEERSSEYIHVTPVLTEINTISPPSESRPIKENISILAAKLLDGENAEHDSSCSAFGRWDDRTIVPSSKRPIVRSFDCVIVLAFERSIVRSFDRPIVRTSYRSSVRASDRSIVRAFDRSTGRPVDSTNPHTHFIFFR